MFSDISFSNRNILQKGFNNSSTTSVSPSVFSIFTQNHFDLNQQNKINPINNLFGAILDSANMGSVSKNQTQKRNLQFFKKDASNQITSNNSSPFTINEQLFIQKKNIYRPANHKIQAKYFVKCITLSPLYKQFPNFTKKQLRINHFKMQQIFQRQQQQYNPRSKKMQLFDIQYHPNNRQKIQQSKKDQKQQPQPFKKQCETQNKQIFELRRDPLINRLLETNLFKELKKIYQTSKIKEALNQITHIFKEQGLKRQQPAKQAPQQKNIFGSSNTNKRIYLTKQISKLQQDIVLKSNCHLGQNKLDCILQSLEQENNQRRIQNQLQKSIKSLQDSFPKIQISFKVKQSQNNSVAQIYDRVKQQQVSKQNNKNMCQQQNMQRQKTKIIPSNSNNCNIKKRKKKNRICLQKELQNL